ncbi:MAG: hypothetical protein Q9220_004760 [cf. Caloplaca sp. 1 TL-2023]
MGQSKKASVPQKRLRKSKKKVAVKKARTAATIAKVKANAETSPLLRLPAEIRSKIFTLVLGGNHVHIHYDSDETFFSHALCLDDYSAISNERAARLGALLSLEQEDTDSLALSWRICHRLCLYQLPSPHLLGVNLSLLRVSRQIYEEANHILWTTNEFMFDSEYGFKEFMNTLNFAQKRKLAQVYISTYPLSDHQKHWSTKTTRRRFSGLQGLKTLDISIKLGDYPQEWVEASAKDMEYLVKPFLGLGSLSVRGARIVLSRNQDIYEMILCLADLGMASKEMLSSADDVKFTWLERRWNDEEFEAHLLRLS